jgi:hypothetical protein
MDSMCTAVHTYVFFQNCFFYFFFYYFLSVQYLIILFYQSCPAEAAGLEGMDLMYAIKNTGTNLEQVTTVPGTAVGVKDTVVDLFTLIKGLVAGDFK